MKRISLWLRSFDEPNRTKALNIINKYKPALLQDKEYSLYNAMSYCYLSINTSNDEEKFFLELLDIVKAKQEAYEKAQK